MIVPLSPEAEYALLHVWQMYRHYGEPDKPYPDQDAAFLELLVAGLVNAGSYQGEPCYRLSREGHAEAAWRFPHTKLGA